MNRLRRIAVTLISFLFVFTSTLSNANTHHTGATLGQFQVGGSGEANYSVPLAIPPGIAGMQPSLSLAYSSQAGNGSLGMGWALGGLSVVHRCPATLIQDSYKGGISYTSDDKLCIDGQRLVVVSGVYGADGTEYRTEKDSYSRITSYGTSGSGTEGTGPAWFKVETKGGQIMEYGNTDDSAIEIEGVGATDIRVWAVNKISDTVSNYLTVTYNEDNANGEYTPASINYTGNTTTGMQPVMAVNFVYETRPDISELYSGGSLIKNTQRMTNIQTYINSTTLIKDYRLNYETGTVTNRSRLISLEECDGGNECKPATQLQWSADIKNPQYQNFGKGNGPGRWPSYASNSSQSFQFTGDFNGDGITDLMYWKELPTGSGWAILKSTGSTFVEEQWTSGEAHYWQGWDGRWGASSQSFHFVGDFNGDGMTDFMYLNNASPSGWVILKSTGSSFVAEQWTAGGSHYWLGWDGRWGASSQSFHFVGDFNGDGMSDFMYLNNASPSGWVILKSTGSSFVAEQWTAGEAHYWMGWDGRWGASSQSFHSVGDFNGDGMSDFMYLNNASPSGWVILKSTGSSFVAEQWTAGEAHYWPFWNTGSSQSFHFVGDFNGDGMTDFMYLNNASQAGWVILKSTGSSFIAEQWTAGEAHYWQGWDGQWGASSQSFHFVGDFNGDGMSDFMYLNNASPSGWEILKSTGSSFVSEQLTTGVAAYWPNWNTTSSQSFHFTGDFNGDGKTGFLYWKDATAGWEHVFDDTEYNQLTTITNGLNDVTSITYKPLTDPTVYTKGSGAAYPEVDIQAPMYVVSHHDTDNGIGGTYGFDYTYGEAKAQVTGRGFLGFGYMETTDTNTGIKTRVDYNQTFPTNGLADQIEVRLSDSTLIEQTINTWQSSTNTDPDSDPATTEALYTISLQGTTKTTNELDGGTSFHRDHQQHLRHLTATSPRLSWIPVVAM